MQYQLVLNQDNGEILYVYASGSLNRHREQGQVYLSLSNAESAAQKWNRAARQRGEAVHVIPRKD